MRAYSHAQVHTRRSRARACAAGAAAPGCAGAPGRRAGVPHGVPPPYSERWKVDNTKAEGMEVEFRRWKVPKRKVWKWEYTIGLLSFASLLLLERQSCFFVYNV